ncbi:MAG: hypothetical protein JJ891_08735 [Rhizobiaceae bacterium]|nr:hypothetical protein [Rhizobiaceae bacterium]
MSIWRGAGAATSIPFGVAGDINRQRIGGDMAKDHENKVAADRRSFLKMAGFGPVVGGAVLATTASAQADASVNEEGTGYRETGHVKTFYNLSRF